jgi:hypothetical protein
MNEPVAWMYEKSNGASKLSFVKEKMIWEDMIETPLFTHSANPKYDPETGEPLIDGYPLFSGLPPPLAKTLTDEEIHEIAEYHGIDSLYETGRLDFARAILRKAQNEHQD